MLSNTRSLRFAAAAAVFAVSAPTFAAALPMVLNITAGSRGTSYDLAPNSVSGGAGIYNGNLSDAGFWNAFYNFNASSTVNSSNGVQTGASAYQNGSFSITNLTASEVIYFITLTLPTEVTDPMIGSFVGSVSGTLITSGPGFMSSANGAPLWVSQTGGNTVAPLFAEPVIAQRSTQGATSIGSRSFGTPDPLSTLSFGNNIGVTFNFRLSAGATASFTTNLSGVGTPVPAPAALAVLACAGLVPTRRRR